MVTAYSTQQLTSVLPIYSATLCWVWHPTCYFSVLLHWLQNTGINTGNLWFFEYQIQQVCESSCAACRRGRSLPAVPNWVELVLVPGVGRLVGLRDNWVVGWLALYIWPNCYVTIRSNVVFEAMIHSATADRSSIRWPISWPVLAISIWTNLIDTTPSFHEVELGSPVSTIYIPTKTCTCWYKSRICTHAHMHTSLRRIRLKMISKPYSWLQK